MLKFHSINNFRCMVDIFNKIFLYCFNRILVLFQKFQLSVGLLLLSIAAASAEEQVVAQLQLRNFSISRSAYSQIESGTYNIRISELIALTEIFRTDYNTIFDGLTYRK